MLLVVNKCNHSPDNDSNKGLLKDGSGQVSYVAARQGR